MGGGRENIRTTARCGSNYQVIYARARDVGVGRDVVE